MSIIVYDRYKNQLNDADELKDWAIENIMESYISSLDATYYDSELSGWEAVYSYICFKEDYNEDTDMPYIVDEEQLYKVVRLANHEFNTSSEKSSMDQHFEVGYYGLAKPVDEAANKVSYTVYIDDVSLDYKGSDIYNVTKMTYPEQISFTLNKEVKDYDELKKAIIYELQDKIEYEIDSPDYIDEVIIDDIDYEIVSIE